MSSRLREIASSALGQLGLIGVSDVHLLTRSGSYAPYQYWEQWSHADKQSFHTDLEIALGKMTAARNDVLLVSPDSHSQADVITWSKNITHLVGMYPPAMMSQRARIGHSAALAYLMEVSGYGCFFANLLFQFGYGTSVSDLDAIKISGNRSTWKNCHIASPTQEPQANSASFHVLNFSETSAGDGLEHYFKNCTIGADTAAWTNGDMIKTSGTPRLVFEDCNFIMRADNAQVQFFDGTAGDGAGFIILKNSDMLNFGTTLTLALGSTGLAAATDYIFSGSSAVHGATDIIAAADEAKVFIPARVGVTEDIYQGLMISPDHTA